MNIQLRPKMETLKFKDLEVGETFVILDEYFDGYVFIKLANGECPLTDEESNEINAFDLLRSECDSIDDLTPVRIIKGTFVEEGINND